MRLQHVTAVVYFSVSPHPSLGLSSEFQLLCVESLSSTAGALQSSSVSQHPSPVAVAAVAPPVGDPFVGLDISLELSWELVESGGNEKEGDDSH